MGSPPSTGPPRPTGGTARLCRRHGEIGAEAASRFLFSRPQLLPQLLLPRLLLPRLLLPRLLLPRLLLPRSPVPRPERRRTDAPTDSGAVVSPRARAKWRV